MSGPPPLAQRRRQLWRWLVALIAVLVIAFLTRSWWLPPVGRFLDVSQPPARVDAVMVLGGGTTTRPFVAAALVKAGLAKRVLLPTVKPPYKAAEGFGVPEQETSKKVLLARGVTAGQIVLLPGECNSTEDEANALARFLETQPGLRVAVVTNNFHTRRARLLFARILGSRIDQVTFVAAPTDGFDADTWWQCEEGVVTYTTEYMKLIQTVLP
jgi:uncharacterized SAM-binding protein YcdF (DUF218 family)